MELWVRSYKGELDFTDFSQSTTKSQPGLEQVAYLEHMLSDDGASGTSLPMDPQHFEGDARVAFFMHFLDTTRPLSTPLGPVSLPKPTPIPARLSFMKYIEP